MRFWEAPRNLAELEAMKGRGRPTYVEPAPEPVHPYDALSQGDKALLALHMTPTPVRFASGLLYYAASDAGRALRRRAQDELQKAGYITQHQIDKTERRLREWIALLQESPA